MVALLRRIFHAFGAHSWIGEPGLVVRSYVPRPKTWPKDLRLRVAMLSDFHLAEPWTGLDALETIVDKTNALEPDIVLLLGDFEEGPRFSRHLAPEQWAPILKKLEAPLGTFAVLGNHDYPRIARKRHRALLEPEAMLALEAAGIKTLVNDAVRLVWRDKPFWLLGLGDQIAEFENGTPLADLPVTLGKITDDAPAILMAHEPDIFPEVPDRVSLTLSGHVHRGQIRFFGYAPVVPSKYGRRYLHGHIVETGRHLIVGAGLGHSGLPLRFDAPPEIVLIELGGAA